MTNTYNYYDGRPQEPMVRARYRICIMALPSVNQPGSYVNTVLIHPDGSIFYEFVEGSEREL